MLGRINFRADPVNQSAYIGCNQESGLSTTATAQNPLAALKYNTAGNALKSWNRTTNTLTACGGYVY
jgi:hypothetical protein